MVKCRNAVVSSACQRNWRGLGTGPGAEAANSGAAAAAIMERRESIVFSRIVGTNLKSPAKQADKSSGAVEQGKSLFSPALL